MSREILTRKGECIIVDDEDFEFLSRFTWYFDGGYACTSFWIKEKYQSVRMHNLIMGMKSKSVDHINRIRSDNRKCNLRFADKSQNSVNAGRKRGITGYRGVSVRSNGPVMKYFAQIRWRNKRTVLGTFLTPEEAALAYDKAAKEMHGEFAILNFQEVE